VDEKSNEAKTALELLKGLVLQGRVITGDAMFCNREVCQTIIDSGGDYFVVVKNNQPTLLGDIAAIFSQPFPPCNEQQRQKHLDTARVKSKGHGRARRARSAIEHPHSCRI